jgi:tetratricopeptide (TPR) repeat protein
LTGFVVGSYIAAANDAAMRTILRRVATVGRSAVGSALLVVVLPAQAASQPEHDALVRACLDHVNNERYERVFLCAQSLQERFPQSPAGPFVAATAHQTMMNDYRVRRFEREFEAEIGEAISRAQTAVKRDPSAENRFMWGAAESYRCASRFRRGDRLKAVRSALRSMGLLDDARHADPAFADPLLGLGLYDHAVSKLPVLGLGLFGDRRGRAIERLTIAHEQGRFVSVNALYALQYVLVDRCDYARALTANEQLFERFPRNPVCLYNRGLILENVGRLSEAASAWRQLVEVIAGFVQPSQGFLAECHYHLARIARRQGDDAESVRLLAEAERHAARRNPADEIDGPYSSFATTRGEIARAAREWVPARSERASLPGGEPPHGPR